MEHEVIQNRIDYFHTLGYLSYSHDTKLHPLLPATIMLVLKVFSMSHRLSFPRVTAPNIKKLEVPMLYVTDLGEKIFIKYLQSMSTELFEMIAPVYKKQFTPETFILSEPRTLKNLRGEVGSSTRTTPKQPNKFHVLVDNSTPFEYLKGEYIFDSIYEARTFINNLVVYLPPSRLELWRIRRDQATGAIRRDQEPVLITKTPYKM